MPVRQLLFPVSGEGGWFFLHPEKACPCGSKFAPSPCARVPDLDRGLFLRKSGESGVRLFRVMPDAGCQDLGHTHLFCSDVKTSFVLSFLYMREICLSAPLFQSFYGSCCFKTQLALFKVCRHLVSKLCRSSFFLS